LVALSLAIATLFPLKETKYKLYEFSSSGQTFRLIDDASTLVKRTPILIKFLARQYVSYRETITTYCFQLLVDKIQERS
jgi:type IV secretory pathway component VirB8